MKKTTASVSISQVTFSKRPISVASIFKNWIPQYCMILRVPFKIIWFLMFRFFRYVPNIWRIRSYQVCKFCLTLHRYFLVCECGTPRPAGNRIHLLGWHTFCFHHLEVPKTSMFSVTACQYHMCSPLCVIFYTFSFSKSCFCFLKVECPQERTFLSFNSFWCMLLCLLCCFTIKYQLNMLNIKTY